MEYCLCLQVSRCETSFHRWLGVFDRVYPWLFLACSRLSVRLVPRPLFRSFPLTENLKQARLFLPDWDRDTRRRGMSMQDTLRSPSSVALVTPRSSVVRPGLPGAPFRGITSLLVMMSEMHDDIVIVLLIACLLLRDLDLNYLQRLPFQTFSKGDF